MANLLYYQGVKETLISELGNLTRQITAGQNEIDGLSAKINKKANTSNTVNTVATVASVVLSFFGGSAVKTIGSIVGLGNSAYSGISASQTAIIEIRIETITRMLNQWVEVYNKKAAELKEAEKNISKLDGSINNSNSSGGAAVLVLLALGTAYLVKKKRTIKRRN